MLVTTRMLALLPHPHELGVVPAAAALCDGQLGACAQPGSVLSAARLGFDPSRIVQAASHACGRASAHAEGRVEGPPQL